MGQGRTAFFRLLRAMIRLNHSQAKDIWRYWRPIRLLHPRKMGWIWMV
jgi:hypothetical protein